MKKCRILALLLAVSLLCCACDSFIFGSPKYYEYDKEAIKKWVKRNDENWHKAFEQLPAAFKEHDGTIPKESYPELFITSDIQYMHRSRQQETIILGLPHKYYSDETSVYVYYSTSSSGLLDFDYFIGSDDRWKSTYESDTAWRWEGGGADGNGYIYIECLLDRWYYVEIFCRT